MGTQGNQEGVVMEFLVPHVDITVREESPEQDILSIVQQIRPHWDTEHIKIERMGVDSGRLNKMYHVYLSTSTDKEDQLAVRINGTMWEGYWNRSNEVIGLYIMNACDCGVPLYSTFNNGYVSRFFLGKSFTRDSYKNPVKNRAFAQALARIHSFDIKSLRLIKPDGQVYQLSDRKSGIFNVPFMYDCIEQLATHMNNPKHAARFRSGSTTIPELRQEYERILEWLDKSNLPLGCVHSDTNIGNVMYDDDTGELVLVDTETFGHSYQTGDLGWLMMPVFDVVIGNCTADDPPISDDIIRQCLSYYLEAKAEISGKPTDNIPDEAVEELFLQAKQTATVQYFTYAVGSGSGDPDKTMFDNVQAYVDNLQVYYKQRHLLFGSE